MHVRTISIGIAAAILAVFAASMLSIDHSLGSTTSTAGAGTAAQPADSTAGMNAGGGTLQSFAGAAPANARQLAAAHAPYPATLPPVHASDVVPVHLTLKDRTIEIAPGVRYAAWTWSDGAPGPVIHVRQGQTVRMTLTNDGAIPHSIDFHAARIAPDAAFTDVMPGRSFTFSFKADDPGVFMYHCGTKPVLMHIANGMYGAIVVDPATPLPHADRSYVLVASEWYLDSDGLSKAAQFDMAKAHGRMPDWMTFNGYAGQYATHPLTAEPGQTVRFYVVDAGPSLDTDFHVVGTLLDRAWVDASLSTPPLRNVQTVNVPAGGGGIFDVKIDEPGSYPFVSHAFAAVDMGQSGVLNVGHPSMTMTH